MASWLGGVIVCCILFIAVLGTSPLPAHWARGTVFFQMSAGALTKNSTIAELDVVKDLGVDLVAIQFMWQQQNATSSDIRATRDTPTNADLRYFISEAKKRSLYVLIKPLVVCGGMCQMSSVNPTDPVRWFASYKKLLLPLAQLAQDTSVEALAVGMELQMLSTNPTLEPFWNDLILDVRAVYSNQLTYGSNPLTNETQNIPFWTQLNSVGIDLYIPMVLNQSWAAPLTPTRAQMKATFDFVYNLKVRSWFNSSDARKSGVPLAILETGYPSSNRGLQQPWLMPDPSTGCTQSYAMNVTAQATAFDVMFEVLSSYHTDISAFTQFYTGIVGNHDYNGTVPSPGPQPHRWSCGWNIMGKEETLDVIRAAFARS